MPIAEISAGLSSLQAINDILKGLRAAKTQAAITEIQIALQEKVLDAHRALLAAQANERSMLDRVDQLEKEIVRLKDWSGEKGRYQLTDLGRGGFA